MEGVSSSLTSGFPSRVWDAVRTWGTRLGPSEEVFNVVSSKDFVFFKQKRNQIIVDRLFGFAGVLKCVVTMLFYNIVFHH